MNPLSNFTAIVALALPLFAHAEDGAQAAKRFHDHNKAVFAQQAKDRVAREQREREALEPSMERASGDIPASHATTAD
ncbi:hypothetical protein [Pseudomonas mosselii]|uniref:hypothetical protein n=1 Tax=Pseudomonas mosselii TaxID=78327 RepID=UPI000D8E9DF2|nr:hypothetical protein [Pseudomonas mosselii]PYC20600.1 hypothetical protein DMX06_13090 [Pseudomonas mosselii]